MARALALVAALLLPLTAACSSDADCEETAGETHVTNATTSPSGLTFMLHLTERTCARVGSNTFHVYLVDGDGMDMEMRAAPADTTGGVEIQSVSAWMPEHGHGPDEDPTVDGDDSSYFSASFQMSGAWELTLDAVAPEAGDGVETAEFDLDVTD